MKSFAHFLIRLFCFRKSLKKKTCEGKGGVSPGNWGGGGNPNHKCKGIYEKHTDLRGNNSVLIKEMRPSEWEDGRSQNLLHILQRNGHFSLTTLTSRLGQKGG